MSDTSPAFLPVAAEPDHPALERRILERWEREGTFERLREANADGPPFSFFDGPITANNSMGVHHAWGRSLKDLFQRYHAGLGEQLRYQNGFDCQGLWVEVEVEKALGLNSKREIEEYGLDRFARACRDRVAEYGELISRQSARLGMWMDWDRSYWTMTDPNISYIWGFLKECQRRGWLYRGHRPMVWCPRCGTSLSQHEMTDSYREVTHPSLHVRFRLTDGDDAANGSEFLLAWTTTPWTLPANVAAAVNPEAQYARVVTDAGHYWLAQDRVAAVFGERAVVDEVAPGSTLVGRSYTAGFDWLPAQEGVEHRVIAWSDVALDEGTGVVHIAPGCGAEDYQLGVEYGLPTLMPVDESGAFVPGYGWLHGKHTHEAAELIIDHLGREGWLFRAGELQHRYPVCWRCGTELIFRVVDEWFISAEEIREPMIEAARTVEWTPSHYGKRMEDWLRNMGDWCISRKRYWGLPLPFYFCPDGHMTIVSSREELHEKALGGLDDLRELHRPWIDGVTIPCEECGATAERVAEVGDCWLDAGIVPFSTLGYQRDEYVPGGYRDGAGEGLTEADLPDQAYWETWFPAALGVRDARADPALVLLDAVHVGDHHRQGAVPQGARLREAERRDRPRDAQVVGQRDLVRRRHRADGRGRDALDVRAAAAGPEHELRLRAGEGDQAPPAAALEHVPVLRPVRRRRGLEAVVGDGHLRAGRLAPARPLDRGPRPGAGPRHPRGARQLQQPGVRPGLRDVLGRPLELVRPPLPPALLAGAGSRVRRRCTTRSCSRPGSSRRRCRSWPRSCGRTWWPTAAARARPRRCTWPASRSPTSPCWTRRCSRRWPTPAPS